MSADTATSHRFWGSLVAVYVRGIGTQRLTILLPPKAGYDVEACLRKPNTLNRALREGSAQDTRLLVQVFRAPSFALDRHIELVRS